MEGSLKAEAKPKQHMRGIVMMIAAFGMFSLLDAAANSLLPELNPPTVIFLRYLIGLVLTLSWVAVLREAGLFRSLHPPERNSFAARCCSPRQPSTSRRCNTCSSHKRQPSCSPIPCGCARFRISSSMNGWVQGGGRP
jgi:hypothetical protein